MRSSPPWRCRKKHRKRQTFNRYDLTSRSLAIGFLLAALECLVNFDTPMRTFARLIALLALLCVAISCTNKSSEVGVPTQTKKPFVAPSASTATTISVTVHFDGTVPAPQKIDMSQDP